MHICRVMHAHICMFQCMSPLQKYVIQIYLPPHSHSHICTCAHAELLYYQTSATCLKTKMWWQSPKFWLILFIIILVILAVIVVIVGMFLLSPSFHSSSLLPIPPSFFPFFTPFVLQCIHPLKYLLLPLSPFSSPYSLSDLVMCYAYSQVTEVNIV